MFSCFRRGWWRCKEEEDPPNRKGKGCFGIWEDMQKQENRKKYLKQREEEKKKSSYNLKKGKIHFNFVYYIYLY
jgi:hypothetical protein